MEYYKRAHEIGKRVKQKSLYRYIEVYEVLHSHQKQRMSTETNQEMGRKEGI